MEKDQSNNPARYLPVILVAFFVGISILALVQTNLSAEDTPSLLALLDEGPRISSECLECHVDYDAGLALTPHALTEDEDGVNVACTDCHAGDARHYEEDPEEYSLTNPATLSAAAAAMVCATCHMSGHQQNMVEGNVHMDNDVNCAGCHSVHGNSVPNLLRAGETELCLTCHSGVAGDFAQPFRHPVNDGIMECSECHMTLDATSEELSLNGTNVCLDCHGEFQGPFPFEHQAGVDYSTEEGACITCHDAHGSEHPRLLKQPYEPPHFQTCTQCHSVPLHFNNAQHGTKWANVSCNDCHTDIHGSYSNRNFLDDSLEGLGCFNSGCHEF